MSQSPAQAGKRKNPQRREHSSKLARARIERDVSQLELAHWTGLSRSTIQRLERGAVENPGIRWLSNCALALGVPLSDVLEDDWVGWTEYDPERPAPPTEAAKQGMRDARAIAPGPGVG
jgi:transcriptional regulator with XRE-family HTH domain